MAAARRPLGVGGARGQAGDLRVGEKLRAAPLAAHPPRLEQVEGERLHHEQQRQRHDEVLRTPVRAPRANAYAER